MSRFGSWGSRLCSARRIGALAAVAYSLAGLAPATGLAARPGSRYTVVVTNRSDSINGRTASIGALNAHPGRDGISLREALQAANHTRGPRNIYIMFGRRLNGRTIWVRSDLPPIHRSHVIIQGLAPGGARAQVTINGAHAARQPFALMLVQASDVTIRWLRFAGVNPRGWEAAVVVRPGTAHNPGSPRGSSTVANIRIEDDIFDNRGFTLPSFGGPSVNGLVIGAYSGNAANRNLRIRDVTITGNRFTNYVGNGDALGVWADGAGARVSGVTIAGNAFANDEFSIELSAGGRGPRQTGTQIVDNRISGADGIGIRLDTINARSAQIDGTQIAGNSIRGVRGGSAIDLAAQLHILGGPGAAPGGDVISNT